jgi:hypothetical protein
VLRYWLSLLALIALLLPIVPAGLDLRFESIDDLLAELLAGKPASTRSDTTKTAKR